MATRKPSEAAVVPSEATEPSDGPTAIDLVSVLKRKSTAPIVEDGHEWAYSKIPYRVNGKRVTLAEYVAHKRGLQRKALKAELAAAVAEDLANPPTPLAESATSKE